MTLMHCSQWALCRPILLILTIWQSNVGFTPLIYLLLLLTKQGLRLIMLSSFWEVAYLPLGTPCNYIITLIDQSDAAMPFVITAYAV